MLATTELVCDEGLLEADTEDKADTYNEEEETEVEEEEETEDEKVESEDAVESDENDVGDEFDVLIVVVVVLVLDEEVGHAVAIPSSASLLAIAPINLSLYQGTPVIIIVIVSGAISDNGLVLPNMTAPII